MNFNQFDIKVLVVSTFALLLISATAGATPIAGGYGEVPTYQTTASLDLSVPEQPGPEVSTEGTLQAGPGVENYKQERSLIQSADLEVNVIATGYNPPDDTQVNVVLEYINQTNSSSPETTLESVQMNVSESARLSAQDVSVVFDYSQNTSSYAEIKWNVRNHPKLSSGGGSGSGLWAALYSIAEWLGYFADLAIFALDALLAGIVFTFTMLTDIVTYVFDLLVWITDGYGSIIASAPAWASAFIAIPILALGFELMKLVLITIEILWIG